MDYEKKYKQALERAEEIIRYYKERNRGDEISIEDLETVFPELAESEDERIKKNVKRAISVALDYSYFDKETANNCLTWVEKQGTPAKLSEKEIQTAKDEMFPYQENVGRSYEQAWAASGFELGAHFVLNRLKSSGYSDETYKQGEFGTFDAPQTPIKDAVEVTSRMQYISDDMKSIAEFIMGYANWDLHKDEWNQPTLTVPLFRVLDALIQRGKPYGECSQNIENQGEQNPVDKVEPFDKYEGLTDFERTLADVCRGWIGEEIGWKDYIIKNSLPLLEIAKRQLLQQGELTQSVTKKSDKVWSEEDENMANDLIEGFLSSVSPYQLTHTSKEIADWLKSIKDRVKGKEEKK